MANPMAPSPNGEPLTVEGALSTLQRLEGFEIGLYQRTEGITWMLWGLITAGIYFTFGTVAQDPAAAESWWVSLLWIPWVAAGLVATVVLWRTAHLAAQVRADPKEGRRWMMVSMLVYVGVFFLGFWLYGALGRDWQLKEPGYVMALLGLASSLFVHLTPSSRAARRMILVVAGVALAAALVLATVASYPSLDAAYAVQAMTGVGVLGVGWFLGGLWLTTKG